MKVTYLSEPDEFLVEIAGQELAYPRSTVEMLHRELGHALRESESEYEEYKQAHPTLSLVR